jgi:TctA family transporter
MYRTMFEWIRFLVVFSAYWATVFYIGFQYGILPAALIFVAVFLGHQLGQAHTIRERKFGGYGVGP